MGDALLDQLQVVIELAEGFFAVDIGREPAESESLAAFVVQNGQVFFGKVFLEKRGQGDSRIAVALARKIEQNETRASVHGQREFLQGPVIALFAGESEERQFALVIQVVEYLPLHK